MTMTGLLAHLLAALRASLAAIATLAVEVLCAAFCTHLR